MAGKRKPMDDVPGIFSKPKRTPLKVAGRKLTTAECEAAHKAFDELRNIPPWQEWFDSLGPQLMDVVGANETHVESRKAARYSLHIWQGVAADLAKPARKRRCAEWYVEWAMKLRWEIAKVNLWPLDRLTKIGGRLIAKAPAMRKGKAKADKIRRRRNRQTAEEAIKVARDKFPSHSLDNDCDTLETEAARIIGKSRRTLNRWLGGK